MTQFSNEALEAYAEIKDFDQTALGLKMTRELRDEKIYLETLSE